MRGRALAVAKFEFFSVTKRWSYLLATFGLPAFLALASAGIFGAQTLFLAQRAGELRTVGLVDRAEVLRRDDLGETNAMAFKWYKDRDAAVAAVRRGEIETAYFIGSDYLQTGDVQVLQKRSGWSLSGHGHAVQAELRKLLLQSIVTDKLDGDLAKRVLKPASFVHMTVDAEQVSARTVDEMIALVVRTLTPVALGVLLLTALLSASGYLVQAIAKDKESKVVEILLASVSPEELLAGKLIGLGLAGLIQFAVWSSMAMVGMVAASTWLAGVVELPWLAFAAAVPFFLFGYLFMGSLMLATASLGVNAAESQKLTVGWVLLAVAPLMALVVLLEAPDGLLAQVFTWIPFTSPITVVIRLAVRPEVVAPWEIIGSLIVLVLATWWVIRVGGRFFRVGFLLTGSRPSWAELLRQARRLK